MPTCQHCHRQWTRWQTYKSMGKFKRKVICPYCGKHNYIAFKTYQRSSWIGLVILIMEVIMIPFHVPSVYQFWALFIVLAIGFMLLPAYYELTSEEDGPS
ncbi:TIGR04104 family putative zinc finger protein [Pullulanibacillus camelliae]|uniref:TIGR04104 family putative zinc finger protein n=1 Tax=Pullulanibacillus camelliae TaxID=1707096 RepID=UPI00166A3BE2|nr:TIGR04104 family putative zinc finger protein [Pullulanibacillus camelliae]